MSLEMTLMEGAEAKNCTDGAGAVTPDPGKSLGVQLVLSFAIGISAFLLFCVCCPLLDRANITDFASCSRTMVVLNTNPAPVSAPTMACSLCCEETSP